MSSDYANGLGAVGVIALALGVGKFQDMLNHRIPIWLGRVSYSLYLVHMPVLYVASQTFAKGAFTIPTTIIVIILSLLIAECMVRMIELSGIRLGKRLAAEQPVG
jgi:peptidoglycan/LPS O-acetylase OafA/YrhL